MTTRRRTSHHRGMLASGLSYQSMACQPQMFACIRGSRSRGLEWRELGPIRGGWCLTRSRRGQSCKHAIHGRHGIPDYQGTLTSVAACHISFSCKLPTEKELQQHEVSWRSCRSCREWTVNVVLGADGVLGWLHGESQACSARVATFALAAWRRAITRALLDPKVPPQHRKSMSQSTTGIAF